MSMKKVKFKVMCMNGAGERELLLPGKKAICSRCDGEGKHTNPAIDGNGISPEEFDEDPDFRESYFSGVFDVPCEKCHGEKVVVELELSALPKALRKRIETQLHVEADNEAEARHHATCMERGIHY